VLIESVSPSELSVSRREGLRSPAFVGLGFLVFAAMPWAEPRVTASRIAASVVFLLVALALFFRGRPRRVTKRFDLSRKLLIDGKRERPWSDAELVLSGGESDTAEDLEPRYRAELVYRPDDRVVVLQDVDPSKVLRDAATLADALGLPLQPGWGLDRKRLDGLLGSSEGNDLGARSAVEPTPASELSERSIEVFPYPVQREVTTAVALGGVGIALIAGLLVGARLERGEPVAPISWGLSLLLVACIFMVALTLRTLRLRIKSNSSIRISRHCLGMRTREFALERKGLRGADCVSPNGAEPLHVVLSTESGLHAFPVPGPQAERVLEIINGV
jgi:hypothetical protein